MTVVLPRSRVDSLVDIGDVLEILREGFRTAAPEPPALRIRTDLPGPGTATCLLPGLLAGVPAYTVKVNAKFPDARPALRGVVCLHDLQSGELLALLDSAAVTSWRTGLAAALGTHLLADPGAGVLGFVGAGAQAAKTLAGLRRLRRWQRVVACDLDPTRAAALSPGGVADVSTPGGVVDVSIPGVADVVAPAVVADALTPGVVADALAPAVVAGALTTAVVADARAVAAEADVVVLATWSRRPLLTAGDVRSGQHLTTLGADEPGKVELSEDLLRGARVIVDDIGLATTMGALGNAGLDASAVAGTLGDVLRGELPAHSAAVSVYAPVGLPWQDLALSWALYQRATRSENTIIDLLA